MKPISIRVYRAAYQRCAISMTGLRDFLEFVTYV